MLLQLFLYSTDSVGKKYKGILKKPSFETGEGASSSKGEGGKCKNTLIPSFEKYLIPFQHIFLLDRLFIALETNRNNRIIEYKMKNVILK